MQIDDPERVFRMVKKGDKLVTIDWRNPSSQAWVTFNGRGKGGVVVFLSYFLGSGGWGDELV